MFFIIFARLKPCPTNKRYKKTNEGQTFRFAIIKHGYMPKAVRLRRKTMPYSVILKIHSVV